MRIHFGIPTRQFSPQLGSQSRGQAVFLQALPFFQGKSHSLLGTHLVDHNSCMVGLMAKPPGLSAIRLVE